MEKAEEKALPADIIANNVFFYYDDLDAATAFYTETLGLEVVTDYDFAKILRVADTSFLTLVSGESRNTAAGARVPGASQAGKAPA